VRQRIATVAVRKTSFERFGAGDRGGRRKTCEGWCLRGAKGHWMGGEGYLWVGERGGGVGRVGRVI